MGAGGGGRLIGAGGGGRLIGVLNGGGNLAIDWGAGTSSQRLESRLAKLASDLFGLGFN